MENATKALLIAGGVLIAIIIISVLVITFQKTGNVSRTYSQTVDQEQITIFNSNFTKYVGQDLTIHEVVTICNFAYNNGTHNVTVNSQHINPFTSDNIKDNLENRYELKINAYDINGYITNVQIISK